LNVIKEIRPKKFSPLAVREYLLQQTSENADWPSDDEFRNKWLVTPAFGKIVSARISYILQRIETSQVTKMTEDITTTRSFCRALCRGVLLIGPFRTEHLSEDFARKARTNLTRASSDNRSNEAARRQIRVDTFNLTLPTHNPNSSVSNGPSGKQQLSAIGAQFNRFFQNVDEWDDDAIIARESLLNDALKCGRGFSYSLDDCGVLSI
jgi:hypothetical protein